MATAMLKCVAKRGRVYRCNTCLKKDEKSRIEVHFYSAHVSEYNVPYKCINCDFRCGDASKRDKHVSSPGHLEKCDGDLITASLAILESQAPRVLRWGEDVEKLSREESRAHWLSVGCRSSEDEERVLDQILNSEDEDIFNKEDKAVQTDNNSSCSCDTEALKVMIEKQNELLNQLMAKTNKCYDMVCSVRREQDRQRDREERKVQGRRDRSRSRH